LGVVLGDVTSAKAARPPRRECAACPGARVQRAWSNPWAASRRGASMILDPQRLNRTWDWAGVGTDLTSHGESDAPPQQRPPMLENFARSCASSISGCSTQRAPPQVWRASAWIFSCVRRLL